MSEIDIDNFTVEMTGDGIAHNGVPGYDPAYVEFAKCGIDLLLGSFPADSPPCANFFITVLVVKPVPEGRSAAIKKCRGDTAGVSLPVVVGSC